MTELSIDMSAYAPIPRDFRFCFKPLPQVENGGPHIDIYLPSDKPAATSGFPIMLMFHGGGMVGGTSRQIPYKQVRYLLSQGIAVASVEYRLAPHVHLSEIRSDLLDSYRYIQTELNDAIRSAGTNDRLVDTSRCAAMGWSAGAMCTIYLAADILSVNAKGQEELPPLKAAIPAYPLTDFSLFDGPMNTDPETDVGKAFRTLCETPCATGYHIPGAPPIESDTFDTHEGAQAAVDPTQLALSRMHWISELTKDKSLCAWIAGHNAPFAKDVSPINLVTPEFPPTFILVAEIDSLIPPTHSYDLHKVLRKHGVEAEVVVAVGMEHGQIEGLGQWERLEEEKGWWGQVVLPALTFAVEHL